MECSGGLLVSVIFSLKKEPTPITFGITEARPHPRDVAPAKIHLGEMDHRIYFVSQSKLLVPRSLRASEPVDPRERGGNDGTVSEPSQLCGCLSLSD